MHFNGKQQMVAESAFNPAAEKARRGRPSGHGMSSLGEGSVLLEDTQLLPQLLFLYRLFPLNVLPTRCDVEPVLLRPEVSSCGEIRPSVLALREEGVGPPGMGCLP